MATLKISDLSVGDWVGLEMATLSIEGNDMATAFVKKAQLPARIKSILGDQDLILVEVYAEDNFGVRYLKMEYIHPIPITAEILEKNGLCVVEEDADFSEYELFGSENFSIFHTKGTLRYRLETPQASVVCWFVHELQHALRLAGVEKEINLQEL